MKRPYGVIQDFLGDRSILVVDPSSNYKSSIKGFCSNLRINSIKFASSARDARREILTGKIGMLIVEWNLPDQNGIQFCRSIRQGPHKIPDSIPFLLMTVENLKKDVVLASEVGIDGYLLKPFSFEDFAESISHIASRKHQPSQLNQLIDAAETALKTREFLEAKLLFEKAIGIKPDSARSLCGLAKIAQAQSDFSAAIRLCNKAISLNSDYIEAYKLLIEIYQEQKCPDETKKGRSSAERTQSGETRSTR